MRRPIKAHLVNRSNRPVYRSKPVTHAILNLDLNSNQSVGKPIKPASIPFQTGYTCDFEFGFEFKPVKPAGILVQTDYTCDFEFRFEFNRFPPVSGQTGPVNRYRRAAV